LIIIIYRTIPNLCIKQMFSTNKNINNEEYSLFDLFILEMITSIYVFFPCLQKENEHKYN